MTQQIALQIFRYSWSFLLLVTVLCLILYEDWPETRAGWIASLIVIVPYLLIFGCYYAREHVGSYSGTAYLRVAGASILFCGILTYLYSHLLLRRNWSVLASIRRRQQLVTTGLYAYVRHPMYSSMLLIVLGSGLMVSNYLMISCIPVIALIYYVRAKEEEKLLIINLPDYGSYMQRTKMFIPWLF